MPNLNLPEQSKFNKHTDEYYLSFPDGSFSKMLLEFSYIDETKWNDEILGQHIAKKIYNFLDGVSPHYYQQILSIEEYRRFIETEAGIEALHIWRSELSHCLSILKNWANTQGIEIFNENQQIVSMSSQLDRFYARLENDEFSDKSVLFYADGKKAIEIITLLIQDENIDLSFRQNQLVALITDGNLMLCADGCVARLMDTAESLRNYADLNLPALIRKFILYLAQSKLKNNIYGVTQPYIIYLCNEEGITVLGNEIHAQNYLINRLLSTLGLESLQIKDDFTQLFKKPSRDDIYLHYEMDFKKDFRAERLIQFIKEHYYQLKGIHFSETGFRSNEDFDIAGLSKFLEGLGQDDVFNLNEVLEFDEDTQKTILRDDQALTITLTERLLNGKWFDLSENSRWVAKYKLLKYFTQRSDYVPQVKENEKIRIFTGNFALSWLKREEKEVRETLLSLLKSETNPIEILKNIPIKRLDYLFENSDDLILFFKTLPSREHSKAIQWLRNEDFDLRATLLSKYFFIAQISSSESKAFFEKLILLKEFNYLFSELINTGLSEFMNCCGMQQLIKDILAESTLLTRSTSQHFFLAYRNFIQLIIKEGYRQFKELTFENPLLYLSYIDFSNSQFEHVLFRTPLLNINFKNTYFNRVSFLHNLNQINFEKTTGNIEIIGLDQTLLIKDVDFIFSDLEVLASQVIFNNIDFSYNKGKILIQGDISDSFLAGFEGLFSLSGNMRATLLDYFSGILQINGDITDCSLRYLKFKKIIINGKISNSYFMDTDFRNTLFINELNLNYLIDNKKNIFFGNFYFEQKNLLFSFFKNSKFSTLSLTQFLNYPGMETYKQGFHLLRQTDLRDVNFQNDELQLALKKYSLLDFTGADLGNVNFDYFFHDMIDIPDIKLMLIDANLKGASFRYANLQYFDFTEADLSQCDFSLANLELANVKDAKIENIKLRIDQLFYFYDQDHTDFSTLRLVGSVEPEWQDKSLKGAKLSSQALQYLIEHEYHDFAFTDLRAVSSNLLSEYSTRIDLDFTYARMPADFNFNRCLGGEHRKKRELCLFDWDMVDQFNEEKIDRRDLAKIVICSEPFLETLKSVSIEQQEQLLEFAKFYPTVGSDTQQLNELLHFSRWQSHLSKLNQVSGIALKVFFAKDTLISFLNGHYDDTAINLGLLSSDKILSNFASELQIYEKALELNEQKLISQLFKISRPFLLRASIIYTIYDLTEAIQSFDDTKFLRVLDDEIYIAIQTTEIILQWTQLLESVQFALAAEAVSLSLGLLVFLGTDIYLTEEYMKQINSMISLTGKEKFYERFLRFFGQEIETYLEKLIEEKQINNMLAVQGLNFLKKQEHVQYFIFPTVKRVEDCWLVPYASRTYSGGGLGGGRGISSPIIKWDRYCNATYPMDLDNRILLDKKIENIQWGRTRPDTSVEGKLFCFMPSCKFKSKKIWMNETYFCQNAIGIHDLTLKTGNYTLIDVDAGHDEVRGFMNRPNIIVARNGTKNLHGGNLDDIFILQDYSITGFINGLLGRNTLELKEFSLHQDLKIDLKSKVLASYNNTKYMDIINIHQVLGRPNKKEGIVCVCDTYYIDSRGGEGKNYSDIIFIPNLSCAYQLTVKVSHNTIINNLASRGNFSYWARGGGIYFYLNSTANHHVVFNYSLTELDHIHYVFHPSRSFQNATISFNETVLERHSINFAWLNQSQPIFTLRDQIQLKFERKKVYILQKNQQPLQEIIQAYPAIALRLKAVFIINTHKEYIVIGSSYNEVLPNNPFYPTHLMGNEGESIYKILPNNEMDSLPRITIYYLPSTKLATEILDLRGIISSFRNRTYCSINLMIQEQVEHLQLNLLPHSDCSFKQQVLTILLNNALAMQWYQRFNIVLHHAPLEIKLVSNKTWVLVPKPLEFRKSIRLMVVFKRDVEPCTAIIMPDRVKTLMYARAGDNFTDLLFFTEIHEPFYGLILKEFYLESGLVDQTLSSLLIKYHANKQVNLENIVSQPLEFVPTINQLQDNVRDRVYHSVFKAHTRIARGLKWEPVASSTARPTFWLFDSLKQVYGLFSQLNYFRLNKSPYRINNQKVYRNSTGGTSRTLTVFKPKLKSIVITCYPTDLLKGSISAILEEISERYKKPYDYLPSIIHYGIKPCLLARSIDLGNPLQLSIYLMTHYLILQCTQTIEQKLTKRIQTKFIGFLIPLLLNLSLFHAYLFMEDDGIERFISELCSHLMQSLLFKTSEWATRQVINQFFKKAPEVNTRSLNEPTPHLINANR